jgi:hypothetical protein
MSTIEIGGKGRVSRSIRMGEGRMGIHGPILVGRDHDLIAIVFKPIVEADLGKEVKPLTDEQMDDFKLTDTMLVLGSKDNLQGAIMAAQELSRILNHCIECMQVDADKLIGEGEKP